MDFLRLAKDKAFIRQFVSYTLLLLTTVSLIGIVIYYIAVGIIQEQSEKSYSAIVSETKRSIDNRFLEIHKLNLQLVNTRKISKLISMKPHIDYSRVDELDFFDISQELTNYKLLNSYIDEIFIYLDNDDIILSSAGREFADNFFDWIFVAENPEKFNRDSLLKNWNSRAIIPNMKFTYLGRKYDSMLQIESIRPSKDIEVKATVVTVVGKDKIESMLKNLKDKGDFDICIVDGNNEIIAGKPVVSNSEMFDRYYSYKGEDCVLRGNVEGNGNIFYHIASDINNWDYVAVIPISLITSKVQQFRNVFISVLIICIIFGTIFMVYLTRKSLLPVKKIVDLINREVSIPQKDFRSEFELIEISIEKLSKEKKYMESELDRYSLVLRNNLLMRLIKGNISFDKESADTLSKYGITFKYSYFKVLIFDMEYFAESGKDIGIAPEALILMCGTLERIISELQLTGFVVDVELNCILMILNIEYFCIEEETNMELLLKKIKKELEESFHVIISLGAGNLYDSMEGIRHSYEEAFQALNYKLIMGKGHIIRYSDIIKQDDFSYYYPMDRELSLIQNLKSADFSSIECTLDDIISENLYKRNLNLNIARCLFYDLEASALKALQEINLSIYSSKLVSLNFSNLKTFEEMISYIKKVYCDICHLIMKKRQNTDKELISDILEDIERNFGNYNFSMNICAKNHKLSDSNMSRYFKEKTGLYFSDYLNKRRIEKAKSILKASDMTIKEIALEVGYINDITLRRIFKRYELITPVQYREQNP